MAWSFLREAPELSPLAAFRLLQNEMERWTEVENDFFAQTYPLVNVWGDNEKVLVTAQIPGIDPEKVEVTVTGDLLSIVGERSRNEVPENTKIHRTERLLGKFSRTVRLPFPVDESLVKADYKDGVLSVVLPRLPEQKPKKIQIN
jgi:HSP20 family protein